MGAWASFGVKMICRWNTDVATDFLHARCPRVVLQDPADEIISHCSSLKCGIATSVALKDTTWNRLELSWKYIAAEFKLSDQVPPFVNSAPEGSDFLGLFNEAFVEHFSACIINIGRRANVIKVCRANKLVAGKSVTRGVDDNETVVSGQMSSQTECDIEVGDGDPENLYDVEEGADADGMAYMGLSSGKVKMDKAAKLRWLEKFCSQNIGPGNKQLHPLERVWIALSRLNGSCGQVLLQAMASKSCYDSVRSWLCCLVVWSPFAQNDKSLPSRSSSLSQCVKEIEEISQR
jgi:hypothetical protein